jgi:TP901 family phage tail tape measure protein
MPESFKVSIKADLTDLDAKIKEGRKKINAFKLKANTEAEVKIKVDIANLQRQLADARQRLRQFRKEGNKEAEIKTRVEIQDLQKKITTGKKVLRDLQGEVKRTEKSFFSLNGIVKDAIKAFAGFEVIRRTFGLFNDAFDAAVSFESAFAGVRKTVDATEAEFQDLAKAFRQLAKDIPVPVEQLARIGELAGQLGIAKEDIIDFTETIAKIAVTTNLSEEQAATSFARIANIFQEPTDKVENLASAVVALGNNFATTESEIVNFATRIAGTGAVVGLSTKDIVAIGTAFTSVGVEAEAGGTAVQKSLLAINDAVAKGGEDLNNFASVAGVSAKDFSELWKSEPVKAFDLFVKGLGNSGDQATAILDELVAGDTRLARAFLSLSQAGDLLTRTIDTSNEAFAENTALSKEAEDRFNTTESQLIDLKGTWNDIAIAVGDFIKKAVLPLLKFLTELGEDLILGTKNLGGFATAVKGAGIAIATYFGINLFKKISQAVIGLAGSFTSLSINATRAATATKAMNTVSKTSLFSIKSLTSAFAFLTNPVTLAAAAVGILAAGFLSAKAEAKELQIATENLGDSLAEIGNQSLGASQISSDIDALVNNILDSTDKIKELNEGFPGAEEFEEIRLEYEKQGISILELREAYVQYLESLGATQEQIDGVTESLGFFRDEIPPTSDDLKTMEEAAVEAAKGFDKLATKFKKNVDALVNEGVDLSDAIESTKDNMADDFEEISADGEEMTQNLLQSLVLAAAETEGLGAAFTTGYETGLTRSDVLSALEQAGFEITNPILGQLLSAAIEAGDRGEVAALLWAAGIDKEAAAGALSAQNLADFVTTTLANNAGNASAAGQTVGSASIGGVIQGIKNKFPQLQSAFKAVLNVLQSASKIGGINLPIIGNLGKFSTLANNAQEILSSLNQAQSAINKVSSAPIVSGGGGRGGGGGGGGGKAKDALREVEKAAKEAERQAESAEKAVEGFNDEIERTAIEAEKVEQKVRDFYSDIVNDIDKAREAQEKLNTEFEGFKQEETVDFVREAGGQAFELDEKSKEVQEEINELLKEEEKDLERIKELQSDLAAIQEERAQISNFVSGITPDFTDAEGNIVDLAQIFEESFRQAGLSDFEQAKIAFEEKIRLKEEEVQAEIAKQQKIIDIQSRFLELQTSNEQDAIAARERLLAIATGEEVLTAEERQNALKELGFGDLSNQEQLDLLKQTQQAETLELEKEAVIAKEEELLQAKKDFFKLAEDAHVESVDNMIDKTNDLIETIKTAQIEQAKLNALRSSSGGGGGSTTNISVTNNNASNVDAEAANDSLINKLNQ